MAILATVAVTALTTVSFRSAQAATPANQQDRLRAGQCQRSDRTHDDLLVTPSSRYLVYLAGTSLVLENHVDTRAGSSGYNLWRREARHRRGKRAILCMQSNGNLVWRVDGKYSWSTKTKGRGNYARVLESGRLVVRTPANRTVWSTHTTPVLLVPGDRLATGRHLVNRTNPHQTSRLEMTRGGDLVLRRGTKRTWHTGTHVRGSYLKITSTGRMVVRTPSGRDLWHSPKLGRHAVMTLAQKGRLTFSGHRCFVRPKHTAGCGVG